MFAARVWRRLKEHLQCLRVALSRVGVEIGPSQLGARMTSIGCSLHARSAPWLRPRRRFDGDVDPTGAIVWLKRTNANMYITKLANKLASCQSYRRRPGKQLAGQLVVQAPRTDGPAAERTTGELLYTGRLARKHRGPTHDAGQVDRAACKQASKLFARKYD